MKPRPHSLKPGDTVEVDWFHPRAGRCLGHGRVVRFAQGGHGALVLMRGRHAPLLFPVEVLKVCNP
jgi:hypothetical protein